MSTDEILYTLQDYVGIRALELAGYPDGLPLVPSSMTPARVLVRPRSVQMLMTALWWVDALVERGKEPPVLILPCLPGARQDRLNDRGDFLFTAKSIAREINLRGFPKVVALDPHSDVMPALIDRCEVVTAAAVIKGQVAHAKWDAVISPDAGAEKRAGAVARMLGLPLLHAWKTRDVATGAIAGFGFEGLFAKDLHCLVVDDICDGGGTFVGLADLLFEAKLDLWTTHGFYSKGTAALRERFTTIFCTDSVFGPRDGVTEIPVCELLLKGLL
jgi:ribose-phosphate pyrophosphokinase